jgi:hypothetical protein
MRSPDHRRTANGERRTANGERRTANGERLRVARTADRRAARSPARDRRDAFETALL